MYMYSHVPSEFCFKLKNLRAYWKTPCKASIIDSPYDPIKSWQVLLSEGIAL